MGELAAVSVSSGWTCTPSLTELTRKVQVHPHRHRLCTGWTARAAVQVPLLLLVNKNSVTCTGEYFKISEKHPQGRHSELWCLPSQVGALML